MGRPDSGRGHHSAGRPGIMDKPVPTGWPWSWRPLHFCMSWRGVREMDSKMLNSSCAALSSPTPELRANSCRS